jgi:hypothetical protein
VETGAGGGDGGVGRTSRVMGVVVDVGGAHAIWTGGSRGVSRTRCRCMTTTAHRCRPMAASRASQRRLLPWPGARRIGLRIAIFAAQVVPRSGQPSPLVGDLHRHARRRPACGEAP